MHKPKGGMIVVENNSLLDEDFLNLCNVLCNITKHRIYDEKRFTLFVDDPEGSEYDPLAGAITTRKNWFINGIKWRIERNFHESINNHISINYKTN